MEQIVLDVNLKYVLAALDMTQRGEILTALFAGEYNGSDETVKNIFCYLSLLNKQKEAKRQKMKELSSLGVAARLKAKAADFLAIEPNAEPNAASAVNRTVKGALNQRLFERKEAKESINNKNNIFYAKKLFEMRKNKEVFCPPDVAEVQAYVEKNGYQVNAETFVDFYDSRSWRVGSTPITNWQATVRLWHGRATSENSPSSKKEDEAYWHELMTKQQDLTNKTEKTASAVTGASRQNLPAKAQTEEIDLNQKPFERFMRRVEKYDISGDEK